jgi:hypothetical protein
VWVIAIPVAECREVNSRRCVPSRRAIAGAELEGDLLVTIRNSQGRPRQGVWLGRTRSCGGGTSFSFTSILHRCRRLCRLIGTLATASALRASVRVDPRRHGGRTGLGLFGNNEAFSLRDLTRVQQLCRTYRFGYVLSSPLTVSFFWVRARSEIYGRSRSKSCTRTGA